MCTLEHASDEPQHNHLHAKQTGVIFVSVESASYKETSALDVVSVGSAEVYCEIKIGKEVVKTPAVAVGKGTTYVAVFFLGGEYMCYM